MVRPPSCWPEGGPARLGGVVLAGAMILLAAPAGSVAQGGLEAVCHPMPMPDDAQCRLAVASMRAVQERVGIALWGGNPVPGTASTQGMRLGSAPRVTVSARVALVPITLPPLPDRTGLESARPIMPAFSAQTAVGVLPGFSPIPTVGGVLSMDVVGRFSVVSLPGGRDFQQGAVVGASAGVRVGALRESLTMPGLSLTASYGRSGTVAYGDPTGSTTDGFVRGAISDLNATLAASGSVLGTRLAGGLAWDRYGSRARMGHLVSASPTLAEASGRLITDRRSWFMNASWTRHVLHATAELGWQSLTRPDGLPLGVRVDPAGWWTAVSLRLSI
jgi:hypothetical protein